MDLLWESVSEQWQDSERSTNDEAGETQQGDREGRLAVLQGQLCMEEPTGKGAWPVIIPGPRVKIRLGDKLLTGPTVLESIEGLSIEVQQEPPVSDFEIIVSRDKMEVILKTRFLAGRKYALCDAEYQQRLCLKAQTVASVPAKAIEPRLVLPRLAEKGIRPELIETTQVTQACLGREDVEVIVARGVKPVPPVDGRVEMVCDLKTRVPNAAEGDRVDILDRGRFNSVNAGDVLAVLHHPVPGTPGMNVYGEEVSPPAPRQPRLAAGSGVKLVKNGTMAVVEVTGRPILRRGVLQVSPQLVIGQNVDVSTGNVEFKGDVVVLGDVQESLTVKAGGSVNIHGSVYHAHILAEADVSIADKLIGGSVSAGIKQPGLAKAVKLLHSLDRDLEYLVAIFRQLKEHPKLSVRDLILRGDGYLVKLILEARLAQVPKKFARLVELLAGEDLDSSEDGLARTMGGIKTTALRFLGAAPLEFNSIEEVAREKIHLKAFAAELEQALDMAADVAVHYCQNAKLEATGSITITGPLAYDCDVVAGDALRMSGACRSGVYAASSGIFAETVGSHGMGKTALFVSEQGVIGAERFYPGVRLRIGPVETVIEEECCNRLFYLREGRLASRKYQQGGAVC